MNTMKRVKLHHLREKIVQDVDVRDIMEHLLAFGAVSSEDFQIILSEKTRTDQVRHLLDLLPKKSGESFDHFVESLRKDYDWLFKEFSDATCETDSVDDKTFYDAFLLGGVPHPPPYNVKRLKKLTEIQKDLRLLKRGNFVVLHGMTGSGKSCLAAAAVDNREILMRSFKGSVYWLTLGESGEDDLLCSMNQLLQRLKLSYDLESYDKIIINKELAKEELKRSFLEESLREGLLILDDVTSYKQVVAFDLGCKIFITTKDEHVMDKVKGRYKLIQVNKGLTEKESLTLLAQSIDVQIDELPQQAKVVHNLSQGCPMILALIAGQLEDNKHDAQCSGGRWDYYVNMLSEKNFGHSRRNSLLEQNGLFQTISMSINNLPSNKKEYYMYFAIFMEDVNIKPEVLQTLWSLQTKYEVEDIMAYYAKKSLAVCKWNEQLRSSVYGIHDLLLYYLKEQLTSEDKVILHKKLLKMFHDKCSGDYAKLPNDNYIYSYIGYHIYHAKEWEMFNKLFLDLNFIQSKLRASGPADVLLDFKKYRNQFVFMNDEVIDKINDFVMFIRVHGLDLYKDKHLDIIQCGLLERKESWVYKEASKVAKMTPQKLFLEFSCNQNLESHAMTLPVSEDIVSSCFTNEMSKILVSDCNGVIWLWELDSLKVIMTFRGHHFKVNHLELHPDNKRFLSCCEDGTLKLWDLNSGTVQERIELNTSGHNLRVSSPQNVQRYWKSMFLDDSPKDESAKTYVKHKNSVLCAKFSRTGEDIVSCSKECYIVWNCETSVQRIKLELHEENLSACCSFSLDNLFLFLGGHNGRINVYDNKTADYVASFCHSCTIIGVFCIPSDWNKLIVVSKDEVRIWMWDKQEISKPPQKADKFYSSSKTFCLKEIEYSSFGKKEKCVYNCAAISKDGIYLVAAASDFVISVWNLRTKSLITEHKNNGHATCLDTYIGELPVLLCGSDDRTVKIWHLDHSVHESFVNLLPNFDVVWLEEESFIPIIAVPDSRNKVQILRGIKNVAETPMESEKILMCAIAKSGCVVFYGCRCGNVKKFHVSARSCEVIMKFDAEIVYLQCIERDDVFLVAAGDMNGLKIWTKETIFVCDYDETSPVVQCFLIPNTYQLMACYENASVKLWDIDRHKLSKVIIGRVTKANVIIADICYYSHVLVLAEANTTFHIASLTFHSNFPNVELNTLITKQIDVHSSNVICSCKISLGGEILALGLDSGVILIWQLKTLQQIKKLKLDDSAVHSMIFIKSISTKYSSFGDVLLVTIGSKIRWWNVSNIVLECKPHSNREECKDYENFWEYSSNMVRNQQVDSAIEKLNVNVPFLLASIKLRGSHALKISSSPNALCFLTVDTSGIVYFCKVVQSVEG